MYWIYRLFYLILAMAHACMHTRTLPGLTVHFIRITSTSSTLQRPPIRDYYNTSDDPPSEALSVGEYVGKYVGASVIRVSNDSTCIVFLAVLANQSKFYEEK